MVREALAASSSSQSANKVLAVLQKRESSQAGLYAVQEDGSSFFIPLAVVLKQHLRSGDTLDGEVVIGLKEESERVLCTDQALRYLAIREHCRAEMTQKLQVKGFTLKAIQESLDNLEAEDSLSEVRFVQSFAVSRLKKHPEGRSLLEARLAAKGARREVVRAVLDDILTPETSVENAKRASYEILRKKKDADKQKLISELAQKGFSSFEIRSALSETQGE